MKETGICGFLKYAIILGLIALLATPFIVTDSLYFPFITGKAYFFRIIVEIIFFFWIVLAVLSPQYRPKKSWILYSIGAFLVWLLIANLQGLNWRLSFWSNFERMEGYVTILHLAALFLVTGSVLQTKKHWIWFFNTIFATSLIMVFLAAREVIEFGLNARVDTTLGNPTYLAVYMLFNAFISLWLISQIGSSTLRNWWSSWQFWLYSIAFVLQSFIVFQTGTRGAILGLIGGIALITILNSLFSNNKKIKKVSISGLVIVAILVTSLFIFKDSSFVQGFSGLKRITSISLTEQTAEARLINWGMAIEGFKERPILGWGQSNYNLAFDKYYDPAMHGNEVWFDRTHNIILDWLIAGGILGLLFYLSILFGAVYLIWTKFSEESILSKSILISMLAAYFVHNFFVFDNLISYLLFFFILSYVHSQSGRNIVSLDKLNERMKFTLITLCIFALPITAYGFNWHNYQANRELSFASQITKRVENPDGSTAIVYAHEDGPAGNLDTFLHALNRQTFANAEIRQRMLVMTSSFFNINDDSLGEFKQIYVQTVIEQLQVQTEETPLDARYPYLLGIFTGNLAQYDLAEQYLLQAISLTPNKQAIRQPLIRVYLTSGQIEKAIELAKETYELDTSKDDIWVEYAVALSARDKSELDALIDQAMSENNFDRVEMLFRQIVSQNPDDPQRHVSLAAFYNQIGDAEQALNIIEKAIIQFPQYESQLSAMKEAIVSE